MDLNRKLTIIEKLYGLYEQFGKGFATVCRKGCAVCCTANVTMTGLEGLHIVNYWQAAGRTPPLPDLEAAVQGRRFEPALTINHLAALCLQGAEVPDDEADPDVGPCPLLDANGSCSIYPVRPFGCRAMVSRSDCAQTGAADMPEAVLSANNLFMQFIEALDTPGVSGNLADILLLLTDSAFRAAYAAGHVTPPGKLLGNAPIPVIMLDPAHRSTLQPLLDRIRAVVQDHA